MGLRSPETYFSFFRGMIIVNDYHLFQMVLLLYEIHGMPLRAIQYNSWGLVSSWKSSLVTRNHKAQRGTRVIKNKNNSENGVCGPSAVGEESNDSRQMSLRTPLMIIGILCSQVWVPLMGVICCTYRSGSLTLSHVAPLALGYLAAFALISLAFLFFAVRQTYGSGFFGILAGALSASIGIFLLYLTGGIIEGATVALVALASALVGAGGALMLLVWITQIKEVYKGRLLYQFMVIAALCALFSIALLLENHVILYIAAVFMALLSVFCYWRVTSDQPKIIIDPPHKGLNSSYARLGLSFGCFGFVFTLMIMNFSLAKHGEASSFTWVFGFLGIAIAGLFLYLAHAAKKSSGALFAYRFICIPVLIALFPVDAGSEFSLVFAFSMSTLAAWCFIAITPSVVRDAAHILKTPFSIITGVGCTGLFFGSLIGYLIAWLIVFLHDSFWRDTSWVFFISTEAIIAIAIAIIATNILLTSGTLVNASKRAFANSGAVDLENDSNWAESIALAASIYQLTSREIEVLKIMMRGYSLKRVQEDLYISEGTAITHRRHIYQKLGVHNKSELIDTIINCKPADKSED